MDLIEILLRDGRFGAGCWTIITLVVIAIWIIVVDIANHLGLLLLLSVLPS